MEGTDDTVGLGLLLEFTGVTGINTPPPHAQQASLVLLP